MYECVCRCVGVCVVLSVCVCIACGDVAYMYLCTCVVYTYGIYVDQLTFMIFSHRYNVVLKKARTEGLKKGLSVSLVAGGMFLILYCMYALGFW